MFHNLDKMFILYNVIVVTTIELNLTHLYFMKAAVNIIVVKEYQNNYKDCVNISSSFLPSYVIAIYIK